MTGERMHHVPVMAGDVIGLIRPAPDRVLLDLTVGAGGHAEAFLLASAPTGSVLGVDRDPAALELARERLAGFGPRLRLLHGDFVTALGLLRAEGLRPDAVLLDLGVSSMQLDDLSRGFSLREDARLDMRMDPRQPRTAADVLAETSEADLVQLLREGGEEGGGGAHRARHRGPPPAPVRSGRPAICARSWKRRCTSTAAASIPRRAPSRRCAWP